MYSVLLASLLPLTSSVATDPDPIVLTQDGQPVASIVVADSPLMATDDSGMPVSTQFEAAETLQKYIQEVSGAKLPIIGASEVPGNGTLVLVGASKLTEAFDIREPAGPEGFTIQDFDRGLAIVGEVAPTGTNRWNKPCDRGSRHGVLAFLEQFLRCRIYFDLPELEKGLGRVIPNSPTIALDRPIDYSSAPAFAQRVIGKGKWWGWTRSGRRNLFRPNHTHMGWDHHYRQSHPEYFLTKEDGSRDWRFLCYSEPGVLQQELKHIEMYYSTGQWFGVRPPTEKWIRVEPGDNCPDCHCPRCQKMLDSGSGRWGRQSRIWFDYVNRLAREVKKRWPDKRVAALAYDAHTYPPPFAIEDNVDLMVCLMLSSNFGKEPEAHGHNLKLMHDWSDKLGRDRSRLYMWDYYCWPQFWTCAPLIYPHYKQRWLRQVRGFVNGEFINRTGEIPQAAHFMIDVTMRLLWEPDLDVDAYLADYCERFFGPAATPMEKLYHLLIDRYENVIWPGKTTTGYASPREFYGYTYTDDVIDRCARYLAEAELAVGSMPGRTVEFEAEGWLIRYNESLQPRRYAIAMAALDEPVVNPTLRWSKGHLTYRGSLARGQRL